MLRHSYLEAKYTGTHQSRAKIYWGTAIYLVPKYTRVQLFRAKILGHSCLEKKYIGTPLFRAKIYWGTAI